MDEQSIWKKEISFRKKDKAPKAPPPPGEEPTSVWKKEISFGRKKKEEAAQRPVRDSGPGEEAWGNREVSPTGIEEPKKQSVWKKEISFGKKKQPKPEGVAEPAAQRPVRDSGPGEGAWGNREVSPTGIEEPKKQSIWKREISFGKKKTPDVVAPAEPVVEAAPVVDDAAEMPDAVSAPDSVEVPPAIAAVLAPVEAEPPVAAPPVHVEPEHSVAEVEPTPFAADVIPVEELPPVVVPEPEPAPVFHAAAEPPVRDSGPAEGDWGNREVSPTGIEVSPVDSEPEPLPLPDPVPAPAPPLDLPPAATVPPATVSPPAAISIPAPPEPVVVHPPVPASELPPEEKTESVPFWKREISVGKKKDKAERAPKAKKEKAPKIKVDRGGKGKKIVGLKIGASQLAAARVTNNGSAELLQVAREPLNPGVVVGGELRDPDALAVALKDFFAKHKLPKRGIRLGIANNRIGVRTFDLEGIDDPKQLDNAIRFRAQEALPIPIDEAVMDYQILSESKNQEGQTVRRVLLVVAYREQIDRYTDACKKAGIGLVGIDLEAFALLRALQAPQSGVGDDPDGALVAVAIGHERSTFAVSDGRVCEFTRVLEWGGAAINVAIARTLDAAPSEVEGIKRALSLMDEMTPEGMTPEQAAKARDAIRRAIQIFARELVSSLQFYQNQPGSLGISEIVLTGGTTHLPGLAAELEKLIGVRVRVGDPLARIKVSKKLGQPEQVGSLAVAIGLGIED